MTRAGEIDRRAPRRRGIGNGGLVAVATATALAAGTAGVLLLPGTPVAAPQAGPVTPVATLETLASDATVDSGSLSTSDASSADDRPAVLAMLSSTRPRNGAALVRRGSGSGRLTVDNRRGDVDAVVTLARGGRAVLVLYVRAGSTAAAGRVPDGTFDVYAEQGSGWDTAAGRFTSTRASGKFDRQARFDTRRTARGIRYTEVRLTLQAVADGNVRVRPVGPSTIPG